MEASEQAQPEAGGLPAPELGSPSPDIINNAIIALAEGAVILAINSTLDCKQARLTRDEVDVLRKAQSRFVEWLRRPEGV